MKYHSFRSYQCVSESPGERFTLWGLAKRAAAIAKRSSALPLLPVESLEVQSVHAMIASFCEFLRERSRSEEMSVSAGTLVRRDHALRTKAMTSSGPSSHETMARRRFQHRLESRSFFSNGRFNNSEVSNSSD